MFLFRKMDMAVNVVLTEAVISGAFRTVSEFELRIVPVRSAADAAFMVIETALLLFSDLLSLPFKAHCILIALSSSNNTLDSFNQSLNAINDVIPAEDEEIQHGNNGKNIQGKWEPNHINDKQCRIKIGKPFNFNRQNKEQQYLHIRKKHCKRKEH